MVYVKVSVPVPGSSGPPVGVETATTNDALVPTEPVPVPVPPEVKYAKAAPPPANTRAIAAATTATRRFALNSFLILSLLLAF
jgi:hypothetical protein